MADLATLQARLAEAETAKHELLTGKRVQVVARDGRRIEYTNSSYSLAQLDTYISELQTQIATLTGDTNTDWKANRRAARVIIA
jgi:hypothetical protein